jgi:hypothetical protein
MVRSCVPVLSHDQCSYSIVNISNFNIKLKQSKHKVLFAIAKPIMLRALRPAFQKAIEKTIKDQVHQLDTYAYQVKVEADRAQREVS